MRIEGLLASRCWLTGKMGKRAGIWGVTRGSSESDLYKGGMGGGDERLFRKTEKNGGGILQMA